MAYRMPPGGCFPNLNPGPERDRILAMERAMPLQGPFDPVPYAEEYDPASAFMFNAGTYLLTKLAMYAAGAWIAYKLIDRIRD